MLPRKYRLCPRNLVSVYGLLNSLHLVSCQLEGKPVDSAVQGHYHRLCYLTLDNMKVILDKYDTSSLEDQTMQKSKKRLKCPFFSIADAKSLVTEIESHKSRISLTLNADGTSDLLIVLSRQADVSNYVQYIKRELQQRRETETRISVDVERHELGLRLRHLAMELWFTEGDEFNTWLNTAGAKLWLYSIPGAGKTVLASSVIQEALAKTSRHVALARNCNGTACQHTRFLSETNRYSS